MKINIQQASVLTGLSVKTLYKWICEKRIGYYKFGNRVLFDEQELTNWMDSKRVNPVA